MLNLPFPAWMPNETLYSLLSRVAILWGVRKTSLVSELLFGAIHRGTQHDFPNGLTEFVARTGGIYGSVEKIAKERTLLRYYRPFILPSEEEVIVGEMAEPLGVNLKFLLGILTSRFRAHHPLKACPTCIDDDIKRYGWPHWHLNHQYPGVWTCLEHGDLLRESLQKSPESERFHWRLPRIEDLLVRPQTPGQNISTLSETLQSLTTIVLDLLNQDPLICIELEQLQRALRLELERRGWLTAHGSLRLQQIAREYLEYVAPLKYINEFGALPTNEEEAVTQLGRLLRPMRTGTHPIRIFLIIDWLYGDAQQFFSDYAGVASKEPMLIMPSSAHLQVPDLVETRRFGLIEMIKRETVSIRKAASAVNVDNHTALSWAEAAGFSIDRRPKKLVGSMRSEIADELAKGSDKREIAAQFGVSASTISRILQGNPELYAIWQEKNFYRKRVSYRNYWGKLLLAPQMLSLKVMRDAAPAVYVWLYRHDNVWLNINLPPKSDVRQVRHSYIDWNVRDIALQTAVLQAGKEIARTGAKQIFLWQLAQKVPALKPKLDVLDKLPLTKTTINQLLSWRS